MKNNIFSITISAFPTLNEDSLLICYSSNKKKHIIFTN
jgi:hypothetical protein